MKNKYIIGALLVGIISLFASCSDDNDSNPTLIQPTEFVLNTPTYANATIDLERSTGLECGIHLLLQEPPAGKIAQMGWRWFLAVPEATEGRASVGTNIKMPAMSLYHIYDFLRA